MIKKDWKKVWERQYDQRSHGKLRMQDDSASYWDSKATVLSNVQKQSNYDFGHKVLAILDDLLRPENIVLDIGTGPGTLVIPISKKVKSVTAVEQSEAMVKCLLENARNEKPKEIQAFTKKWEDMDISNWQKKFDMVIACRMAFHFRDIWDQLKRMEQVSKGYCVVIDAVNEVESVHEVQARALWKKIMGSDPERPYPFRPYHHIPYHILRMHNRRPKKKIISYQVLIPRDNIIAQYRTFYRQYLDVTPRIRKIVKDHVMPQCKDGIFTIDTKAQIMWWRPVAEDTFAR